MRAGWSDILAGAAWGQLVSRDAPQVGGVDEQLVLGDAHGQDIGDVLIGDSVAISIEGDEAVDGADAVDDAGGVVGVAATESIAITRARSSGQPSARAARSRLKPSTISTRSPSGTNTATAESCP